MQLLQTRLPATLTSLAPSRPNQYLLLLQQLQQRNYFQQLLHQQNALAQENLGPHPQFKTLRKHINRMLEISQLIRWGSAYHPETPTPSHHHLLEQLIAQAYSDTVSPTHETLEEQKGSDYHPMQFHLLFQLAPTTNPSLALLYLNYMPSLRRDWPLELLLTLEALGEGAVEGNEELIVERCRLWLGETMVRMGEEVKGRCPSCVEMKLLLSGLRGKEWGVQERGETVGLLGRYLSLDLADGDSTQSFVHLQNIVKILSVYLEKKEEGQVWAYLQGLYEQHRSWSSSATYLATFFSHEDALTCLKADLWLHTLHHGSPLLKARARAVLNTLPTLRFSTWKYKYLVWIFDSLLLDPCSTPELIQRIHQAIVKHRLSRNNLLSSYLLPFATITQSHTPTLPSHLLNLQTATAQWLLQHSDQELLSQPYGVLCEVLPQADRHPFLRQLYLPYLLRLLGLSLGRFEWQLLAEVYYFGLRWGAEGCEAGRWDMEYVRRYIMAEYSVMGSRRGLIPGDSYFYRIHEQTTADKFYSPLEEN